MKIKATLIISIIISFLLLAGIGYNVYIKTIDTKYATKFARALKGYDINAIDKYFSLDTEFIYKENKKTYKELRENIKKACYEKSYEFRDGSLYGHGNDKFINNLQTVNIKVFGKIYGKDFGECNISMVLRKKGFFSFTIESLKCDETVFGDLFFGGQ